MEIIKRIPIVNKFSEIFWKYLIISVIATLIDVGLLYCLTEYASINYLISATISYCFGMIINYSGQKIFTFNDKDKRIAKQFFVFAIVSVIGLFINLAVLKICVDFFGIYYIVGKVIAIAIGFIWNYTINKKITFKN